MKIKTNKKLIASLVFTALTATSTAVFSADTMNVIVKLKSSDVPFSVANNQQLRTNASLRDHHQAMGAQRQSQVRSFVSDNRIAAKHIYKNAYYGFSATLSQEQIDALKADPKVAGVYEDKMKYLYTPIHYRTEKKNRIMADWPQVSPQAPVESGAAESSYKGKGQHVYVLDTGVSTFQNDLASNLGNSYAAEQCFWDDNPKLCPTAFSDDNGHGTHVAGTAVAADNAINSLGMAPEATLHAVKICSRVGGCPDSSILDGLDWAVGDMLNRGQPAVANLSLGGPNSDPVGECTETGFVGDNVVAESYCNAAHQGMVVVVAAGNSADDAANYTPAGYDSTITVSSYATYDDVSGAAVYSSFTNYGQGENNFSDRASGAIAIAAPGSDIVSLNRTHAIRNLSGTSMASPAVAGAAALIMEKHAQMMDYSAFANVRQMLVDNATVATSYSQPDGDVELGFPHEEGLLNVRFLDESGSD